MALYPQYHHAKLVFAGNHPIYSSPAATGKSGFLPPGSEVTYRQDCWVGISDYCGHSGVDKPGPSAPSPYRDKSGFIWWRLTNPGKGVELAPRWVVAKLPTGQSYFKPIAALTPGAPGGSTPDPGAPAGAGALATSGAGGMSGVLIFGGILVVGVLAFLMMRRGDQ